MESFAETYGNETGCLIAFRRTTQCATHVLVGHTALSSGAVAESYQTAGLTPVRFGSGTICPLYPLYLWYVYDRSVHNR